MNVVSIYITVDSVAKRIELFNDEKISVTSSLSNVNDIGKVFTDYSQSFTVPASDHNNSIFKHWYESEVDGGFLHGQRYNGYIEINTVLFKEGKFQLEKANKKNGRIESYTVTFYGNLTQLKDLFKDDKLNTLNYTDIKHLYNSAEIKNRLIASPVYSVMYPIIGSAKKYEYKTTSALNDITLTTGAVKWNELFPAIKVKDIIAFIQTKYGITFTGSFLDLLQWKNLWLYCKNAEKLDFYTEKKKINFTSIAPGYPFAEMNLITDTITTNWTWGTPLPNNQKSIWIKLDITPSDLTKLYRVFVYKNGVLFKTFSDLQGTYLTTNAIPKQSLWLDSFTFINEPSSNVYTFSIDSVEPLTFNCSLRYDRLINGGTNSWAYGLAPSTPTTEYMELSQFVPDITITDFITGLVKMFNLIIIPNSSTSFELIPLELYYNAGNINDVTEYIRSEEADIERPKLFKSISFNYEKSSNILNNAFYRLFNLEYGDLVLNNVNMNESSSYEIKLPFENIMFERAKIGTNIYNFSTATLIDKDLKPYTPKPIFLYSNGLESVSAFPIKVTTESPTVWNTINSYNRFSNEMTTVPTDLNFLMSSNFGEYQSPWFGSNASNGLYKRHYENYIANIYNNKTRIIKVKAVFPDKLLGSNTTNGFGTKLGLKLNDRLIIRDKRYIINSFTTDLTTGETDLELINDYRGADAVSTVGYKLSSSDIVRVDNTGKEVEYTIYKNEYDSFNILPQTSGGFVKYVSVSDCVEDTALQVIIDPNTSGVERTGTINLQYFKNGVSVLTTYLYVTQDA
jgi:hypothetical protein